MSSAASEPSDVQFVLTVRDGPRAGVARVEVYLREGMPAADFAGLLRNLAAQWEDGSARRLS